MSAANMELYVHLIPSSTKQIEESIKAEVPNNAIVNDLLMKVQAYLKTKDVRFLFIFNWL